MNTATYLTIAALVVIFVVLLVSHVRHERNRRREAERQFIELRLASSDPRLTFNGARASQVLDSD